MGDGRAGSLQAGLGGGCLASENSAQIEETRQWGPSLPFTLRDLGLGRIKRHTLDILAPHLQASHPDRGLATFSLSP